LSRWRNRRGRLGSGDAIPIAHGNLDYVFANMYLHHVEEPQKASPK
jgi:hypothetical protein